MEEERRHAGASAVWRGAVHPVSPFCPPPLCPAPVGWWEVVRRSQLAESRGPGDSQSKC